MIDPDGFNDGHVLIGTLPRLDGKPHPLGVIALEQLEIECMERRGTRTGVDLGFRGIDAPVGESDPLSPPHSCGVWLCHLRSVPRSIATQLRFVVFGP